MEVLNNLEDVELLTTYQKNDIIVSTCLFLILFSIYKMVLKQLSLFEIIYMTVAFLICYLTVVIFYNYISFFT
jgi:hypothetical protein